MNIKELMGYSEEPTAEERYIDHLIYSHWMGAKELLDNISEIPTDYIDAALSEIDSTIALLALAKLGLENKKQ